jgi:hypothetical protein
LTSLSLARIRFLTVNRLSAKPPLLVLAQACVKPRKSNVSGRPRPRSCRLLAACRPNSITRVFSDFSSKANLARRSLRSTRNRLASSRWQGIVGRPEIQKFAGSLEGARARKGVFITTSSFTPDAHSYVRGIEKRIVLIDGPMLADLMIKHGVGVTPAQTYVIPKVDQDYFAEE